MKPILPALLLVLTLPAWAGMDHTQHGAAGNHAMVGGTLADATVKKVDKAKGKLTLRHGPIANLDMPPMTMGFRVKDAGLLDRLKAGDKIRFRAERVDGAITVTHVEPAR